MRKLLFIINLLFFWLNSFSQNVGMGYTYQVSSPYANYFPSKSYSFPDDYFSYVYDDGSSRDVIRTGNYYDFLQYTHQSGFAFLDFETNNWINYIETGISNIQAEYAMATGFEHATGLREFYRVRLSDIFFSFGKSIDYFTTYSRMWTFNGVFLITSSALVQSDVMFSHQSFEGSMTSDISGRRDAAEKQLKQFNFGLSTQQRVTCRITEKFRVFVGGVISVWGIPVSGSNEGAHSYLDQFEDERGELYRERTPLFFIATIQTGITWHFDVKDRRKGRKRRGIH